MPWITRDDSPVHVFTLGDEDEPRLQQIVEVKEGPREAWLKFNGACFYAGKGDTESLKRHALEWVRDYLQNMQDEITAELDGGQQNSAGGES